jgi:D-3-phosphoglycerate dehydrogenase
VAKIALGCGMKVIASDSFVGEADIKLDFYDGQTITLKIKTEPVSELIQHSDFITLHVPAQKNYVIGKAEIAKMKDGAAIINAARGGVIDEIALIEALDSGKLSFAALDTFEKEPTPAVKVLMNERVSLSPHIGAATNEAQDRIGTELADQIIEILQN